MGGRGTLCIPLSQPAALSPGPRQVMPARRAAGEPEGLQGEVDLSGVRGRALTRANFAGCVVGLSTQRREAGGCGVRARDGGASATRTPGHQLAL